MIRTLERYELLEEIGQGGMATVYRARDTRLNRLVALKVLHPHLRNAQESRIRFTREAQTIAMLKHPGILTVYEYSGEDSAETFIAEELLTGPTLKTFGETHPDIPAEIAAAMVLLIANALGAAHHEGVIHRDVKPENILIHEARTLKLTDFGIAHMRDALGMTVTGQVIGSPGHMAPEQIEALPCDARSDIFSLGTVLYYLATSKLPFPGKNPHQILKRVIDGRFVDPLVARASIGAPLANIIQKMLAKDPAHRYQDAQSLCSELLAFLSSSGIDEPAATLERYLQNPAETSKTLRTTLIDRLITTGQDEVRHRKTEQALQSFNRVLALDENNQSAIAGILSIGAEGRRARRMRAFLGGLIAIGAAIAATAIAGFVSSRQSMTSTRRSTPKPETLTASFSQVPDSGPMAEKVAAPPEPSPSVAAVVRRTARKDTRLVSKSRTVRFVPSPLNVSIGIDGAPPRAFGPSFRETLLSTGLHHFKAIGGHGCCEDQDFSRDVPQGEGVFELKFALAFRPASIYIVSNVPADVLVDGHVAGRTRSLIRVPMNDTAKVVSVQVSASGYQGAQKVVSIRAGELSELNIDLAPN